MGLREIRQRLRKLYWRLLMRTTVNVPERNQIVESGSNASACVQEQCQGQEPLFGMPRQANGHGAASSAFIQRKRESDVDLSARAKKHFCAGDIAREILGRNSGATISNVLVVGTNGSRPRKRMQIHFNDPAQVPAVFSSLAAALKGNGFEYQTAWNSGIPAAEIWLTCPLDDRTKALLSCGGPIAEQVAAGIAVQAGSPRE